MGWGGSRTQRGILGGEKQRDFVAKWTLGMKKRGTREMCLQQCDPTVFFRDREEVLPTYVYVDAH